MFLKLRYLDIGISWKISRSWRGGIAELAGVEGILVWHGSAAKI